MALEICICHAAAGRAAAETLARRLGPNAEARVWLDACAPGRIVESWESALLAGAVILVLTPDAVPPRVEREDWAALLQHFTSTALPAVATVLVEPCRYPKILERRAFHQWNGGAIETLRALDQWALGLYHDERHGTAAAVPGFQNHPLLDTLWKDLADRPGERVLDSGSLAVAQQFAHDAARHFRDIVWVDAAGRAPESILGGLGAFDRLVQSRVLLLAYGASLPFAWQPDWRASLLRVPEDQPVTGAAVNALHLAMASCRRAGFPLALAAAIAGLSPAETDSQLAHLIEGGHVVRRSAQGLWCRLRGPVPDALAAVRRRHAEVLRDLYLDWQNRAAECLAGIAEFEDALQWALDQDLSLAAVLALRGFDLLRSSRRLAEGIRILRQLRAAAVAQGDLETVSRCDWELSWVSDSGAAVPRPVSAGSQLAFDFLRAG